MNNDFLFPWSQLLDISKRGPCSYGLLPCHIKEYETELSNIFM